MSAIGGMAREGKARRAERIELAAVCALRLASCISRAKDAGERAEMMAAVREQWSRVGHLLGVPRELHAMEGPE